MTVASRARASSSASPPSASSGRPASSRSSLGVAHGEHDRHRLGQQAPRDERRATWAEARVEPLRVVDEAQQRPLAATSASRLSAARATRKRSGGAPDASPKRDAQRDPLRLGKRVEAVEHRRAELMQPRERQLHLGLDAGDPRDAEARRLPGAVLQQGGLADARLAADDQDGALAAAHVLQQPVERLALAGSAQQHRGTARGHCERKA